MNFSLVKVVGKVVVLGNRDILVVGKVVVLGQKWGRFQKNPLVTLIIQEQLATSPTARLRLLHSMEYLTMHVQEPPIPCPDRIVLVSRHIVVLDMLKKENT